MSRYIAPALLHRLRLQRAAPNSAYAEPPSQDYFLKAQDYLEDWLKTIQATPLTRHRRTATVSLLLGHPSPSSRSLTVRLTLGAGRWRIASVLPAPTANAQPAS